MQKLTVTITSLLENLPKNGNGFSHAFMTFTRCFNLAESRTVGAGLPNMYRLVRAVTFCTSVAAYLLIVSDGLDPTQGSGHETNLLIVWNVYSPHARGGGATSTAYVELSETRVLVDERRYV